MRIWHHRTTNGDTIVEVLIALAIIAGVLAGAFGLTRRSTMHVEAGQEHAKLLYELKSQIEFLRGAANHADELDHDIFSGDDYFCFDGSSTNVVTFNHGFTLPAINSDDFSHYPAACSGIDKYYNVAIKYDPATRVFTAYGRWDSITGSKSEEQLYYRVYGTSPTGSVPPGCVPITITPADFPPGGPHNVYHLTDHNPTYTTSLTVLSNIKLGCSYHVQLRAQDPTHPDGTEQPHEQLAVRFLKDDGTILYTSGLTDDFPDAVQYSDFKTMDDVTFTTALPDKVQFVYWRIITGEYGHGSVEPSELKLIPY